MTYFECLLSVFDGDILVFARVLELFYSFDHDYISAVTLFDYLSIIAIKNLYVIYRILFLRYSGEAFHYNPSTAKGKNENLFSRTRDNEIRQLERGYIYSDCASNPT